MLAPFFHPKIFYLHSFFVVVVRAFSYSGIQDREKRLCAVLKLEVGRTSRRRAVFDLIEVHIQQWGYQRKLQPPYPQHKALEPPVRQSARPFDTR